MTTGEETAIRLAIQYLERRGEAINPQNILAYLKYWGMQYPSIGDVKEYLETIR